MTALTFDQTVAKIETLLGRAKEVAADTSLSEYSKFQKMETVATELGFA